jgi:hypothetical protein
MNWQAKLKELMAEQEKILERLDGIEAVLEQEAKTKELDEAFAAHFRDNPVEVSEPAFFTPEMQGEYPPLPPGIPVDIDESKGIVGEPGDEPDGDNAQAEGDEDITGEDIAETLPPGIRGW